MAMARGAWTRAMTPAVAAAGADVDRDPFGLFAAEKSNAIAPYDPAVFQAMQDDGKFR